MIKVRISRDEDREKLIACADEAFGDSVPEGGFAGLLPKLYGPRARVGGNHLAAEEDGDILGVVLAEPMEYRVFGERLKIASVGTVSAARHARGRGIMRLLMDETVRRLRKENYAFAFLGGQRQRYAYWGFHGCGTQTSFSWNQANLKHGPEVPDSERIALVPMGVPFPGSGYSGNSSSGNGSFGNSPSGNGSFGNSSSGNGSFGNSPSGNGFSGNSPLGNSPSGNGSSGNSPLENGSSGNHPLENGSFGNSPSGNGASGSSFPENIPFKDNLPKNALQETDPHLTEEAWRMWSREEAGVWRDRERFFDILCSWRGKPYACMKQGRFAGYVVLAPSEGEGYARILELVLEKGVSVLAVLHALADCLGITQGSVKPGYAKQGMMRELEEICEGESLGCSQRFLILDWCRVLKAMLTMKQHTHSLEDGEVILGITEEDGKRTGVWIRIQEGCLTVAREEEREALRQKEEGRGEGEAPVRGGLTVSGGSDAPVWTEETAGGGVDAPVWTEETVSGGSDAPVWTEETVSGGSDAPVWTEETAGGGVDASVWTEETAGGGSDAPLRKEETCTRGGRAPVRKELTAAQAARLLFRSTQICYKELEGLPAGWFPLPLYVSEQDCC